MLNLINPLLAPPPPPGIPPGGPGAPPPPPGGPPGGPGEFPPDDDAPPGDPDAPDAGDVQGVDIPIPVDVEGVDIPIPVDVEGVDIAVPIDIEGIDIAVPDDDDEEEKRREGELDELGLEYDDIFGTQGTHDEVEEEVKVEDGVFVEFDDIFNIGETFPDSDTDSDFEEGAVDFEGATPGFPRGVNVPVPVDVLGADVPIPSFNVAWSDVEQEEKKEILGVPGSPRLYGFIEPVEPQSSTLVIPSPQRPAPIPENIRVTRGADPTDFPMPRGIDIPVDVVPEVRKTKGVDIPIPVEEKEEKSEQVLPPVMTLRQKLAEAVKLYDRDIVKIVLHLPPLMR
jgi:hypothetical protein